MTQRVSRDGHDLQPKKCGDELLKSDVADATADASDHVFSQQAAPCYTRRDGPTRALRVTT